MSSSELGTNVASLSWIELQRFEQGEITEREFLEGRLDQALDRLGRYLTEERREMYRELILEMFDTDPVLVELVRRVLAKGRQARGVVSSRPGGAR
jgi:hypothetical protein